MFGKTILGAALIAVMATASAEVTVNHAFISFETVAAAQKNVKADEYVQLTGHLVKTTDADVYELKDATGTIAVTIPRELHASLTFTKDDVYEVLGRAYFVPFETLRIDAEKIRRVKYVGCEVLSGLRTEGKTICR